MNSLRPLILISPCIMPRLLWTCLRISYPRSYHAIIPGDQEGLFKLAVQLRNFLNSVIYNTATGYVLLVYLTII
jgi:hypothetical protein